MFNCSYVHKNVQYSMAYRNYSVDLPKFLQNRPRDFVLHVCKRWHNSAETKANDITQIDNSTFVIRSKDSSVTYEVRFGNDTTMPHCECFDWNKFHWPCKHFCAVFRNFASSGWDQLSMEYRSSPYFVIDNDVIAMSSSSDGVVVSSDNNDTGVVDCDLECATNANLQAAAQAYQKTDCAGFYLLLPTFEKIRGDKK